MMETAAAAGASVSFARSISRSSPSSLAAARCFRFIALSVPPILGNFNSIRRGSSILHRPMIRTRASITARPSSEVRNKRPDPNPDAKLTALRELFLRPGIGIDAYIIPSEDAHQSEFIAECFMRRAYVTGFTGSAGTAVVTKDKAALWTDGRYFLQAEKQLNSNWILMRAGNIAVPTTSEWLNDVLDPGCRIGIDPFLFSSDVAEELKEAIAKKNHELVFLYDFNLVDEIWKETRPNAPNKPLRVHDIKFAGVDASSKLASLRSEVIEAGSTAIVISMLDEIAWLLNVRGSDIPHSPVTYAYLIVEIEGAKLFIDDSKITEAVRTHLKNLGVELRPYKSIIPDIESLAMKGAKLWLDTSCVNAAIVNAFKSACNTYLGRPGNIGKHDTSQKHEGACIQTEGPAGVYKVSPITLAKAVKNHAEIEGMKNSHLRDAAALAEFWAWLEEEIRKNVPLTELDVADKLFQFRAKQYGFLDTSFDTISGDNNINGGYLAILPMCLYTQHASQVPNFWEFPNVKVPGYGANGAIIHYRPEPKSCSVVGDKKLFLLDSGAQYVDGTTDITRTVHFGEPTLQQKECFTRVLQGHIALDQAVFPENTPGFVLDILARSSLWKIGLDYRHGTGHGVGAGLNVHEGPQSISFRYGNMTALQKGMIVSNEPGYYEDHSFGIRIENLLYIKEINTPNCFGGVGYLGFEKLTFVPIQSKLINLSLLSPSEINWLNDYHSEVWEKVSPLVEGSARQWLWNNTRPLSV